MVHFGDLIYSMHISFQDPMIGDTLDDYINDIKSTMSGSFLEFYKREFDFFDSVTEVSSIIKPYPKVSVYMLLCQILQTKLITHIDEHS